MRALLCTSFGTPPVLEIGEAAEQPLSEGQVRVAVGAVGLGLFDVVYLGSNYQERPTLPAPVGREHAGRIVEVGPGGDLSLLGRLVAAIAYRGAFVERAVVDQAGCILLPDDMDVTRAACLPSPYATALHALKGRANIQPSEWVLILGAAGTVGVGAIHVARAVGARVVAMASTQPKRDYCAEQGAELVVDGSDPAWRKELEQALAPSGGKVDVVVDPVGGALSEAAFRCLGRGGRHLVIGFASGEIPRLPLNLCLLKQSSAVGVDLRGFIRDDPTGGKALMRELGDMVVAGDIAPMPGAVHSIAELPNVLQELAKGRTVGKPVVRIDGWDA